VPARHDRRPATALSLSEILARRRLPSREPLWGLRVLPLRCVGENNAHKKLKAIKIVPQGGKVFSKYSEELRIIIVLRRNICCLFT
jgi:hypothetical protein